MSIASSAETNIMDSREEARIFVFERLEYGKLCSKTDGPIAGTEYRILGHSSGYPASFLALSHPDVFGLGLNPFEIPLQGTSHGTVLGSVSQGDGMCFFQCRLESHPEDLSGVISDRSYIRGRYLVSEGPEADPLSRVAAFEKMPLQGLTSEDAANVDAIQVAHEPQAKVPDQEFLAGALRFLLSGIPVGLSDPIDEADFFARVASVWRCLPSDLRPWLTAGWAVGRALSGRLAITFADELDDCVAAYSPETGRWTEPLESRLANDPAFGRGPFHNSRLAPGKAYQRFSAGFFESGFSHVEGARGRSLFKASTEARIVGFDDREILRAFRLPGLDLLDRWRLDRLRLELRQPPDAAPLRPFPEIGDLAFEASRDRYVELCAEALANPDTREQTEAFLVSHLSREQRSPLVCRLLTQSLDGDGSRVRLRLLVDIWVGSIDEVLVSLRSALEMDAANGFSAETCRLFRERSPRLFDPKNLREAELHAHLLVNQRSSSIYHEALEDHIELLALAVLEVCSENRAAEILELLDGKSSRLVEAMLLWCRRAAPSRSLLKILRHRPAVWRNRFSDLIRKAWAEDDEGLGRRRETLLAWLELLIVGDEEALEPILAFALGERDFSEAQERSLGEAVEAGDVPRSLFTDVGAWVISTWPRFDASIRDRPEAWSDVVSAWPRPLAIVLTGNDPGPRKKKVNKLVHLAVDDLTLSATQLQERIDELLAEGRSRKVFSRAGSLLWQLISRAEPPLVPVPIAAELCRQLAQADLEDMGYPSESEIRKASELMRFAPRAQLEKQAGSLWKGAKAAWQLRLLLEKFPSRAFRPTPHQLMLLRREAAWLKSHLSHKRATDRRPTFLIATRDFHATTYPGSEELVWREEFRDCGLWAVFAGVPLEQQGSLSDALNLFAETPEVRARLCERYCREHARHNEDAQAAERCVEEFLKPYLSYRLGSRLAGSVLEAMVGGGRSFRRRSSFRRLVYTWKRWRARQKLRHLDRDQQLSSSVHRRSESDTATWLLPFADTLFETVRAKRAGSVD